MRLRLFGTRLAMLCMAVCAALVLVGCKNATSSSGNTQSESSSAASSSATQTTSASTGPIEGLKKDGGLAVEFVAVEDVATALAQNCDVVMGVPQNEANGFDVVGVYAQNALSFFHHGEPTVLNVDDINGKTVGIQDESPAQVSLRLTGFAVQEVPTPTVNEAFDAIDRGDVDLVLSNAASGAYLSSWRDEICFAGALEEPVSVGAAIASGEGSVQTALRAACDHIKENGVLDEVRRTWLGNLPTLTTDSMISGVPSKEAPEDLPAKPAAVELEEVSLDAKDGSAAGANAVTMSEVQGQLATGGSSAQTTYGQ